ncbi:RHS repeat-associated core domain-containing protein [Glaesserella sp.]|uniref:RHS repeat-associated core domain-containing protein n=1 Tax=Glaesserella sp. TaxID=2094731 RepID=UPI0035A0222B
MTYQAQAENGFVRDPFSHGYHEQRMVEHADVYQTGHKLNRINDHHYTYDNAGRLSESTLIQHGFRQKTTYYRWNGNNQLESLTNAQGEVWYYKYDALGRRISKDCPQQHLRIEYLWDGDQLAFTQTFKRGKLHSHRHSVFHGWQLIAQQDYYSEFTQNHFGNHTEWKHETSYAITQPNGQVLALFNPQGKKVWTKEKGTLWGLLFPNDYRKTSPLDPQLLFSGQYYDDESGLAYNRFRYYDPQSGNYLSSDPIGLNGGETPYGYVLNTLDWGDPLGLANCRMPDWMPTKRGYQRHHIVPYSLRNHPAFKRTGLDINSALNLIYLPVAKGIHPTKSIHSGWSTAHKIYNNKVGKMLDIAEKQNWGADKILEQIREIRKGLNTGTIGDLI